MSDMRQLRDLLDILDAAGVQYVFGSDGKTQSIVVYFTMIGARGTIEFGDGQPKLVCFAGSEMVSGDYESLVAEISNGSVSS